MTNPEKDQKGRDPEVLGKTAGAEEDARINLNGLPRYFVPTIAVLWSLFQLCVASWLILDTVFIRAIHLGFAILIVFLHYPLLKRPRLGIRFLWVRDRIPFLDCMIGLAASLSAVYIVADYEGIALRYGAPIARDIVIGVILIILILEASRRVIGPALPIIACLFSAYAFLGPYMPQMIAFKGVSLSRFIGQMTMSTEGIYGIPLDVSATIVFLFVLLGAMLNQAGAGEYFIRIALSLLGRFKGGPAKAAVLGSGLTG
ncbi:MAG: TRAP transporter large permease subunit, partial [Thermodesulfobacteriota bacterium]|nr:TRAP transporter large permease subunit [Thermodesulfobacteriota bacterium]